MITKVIEINGNKMVVGRRGSIDSISEYYGLSSDAKPNDANNADIFYEMDTKKVYLFDEVGHHWIEQ